MSGTLTWGIARFWSRRIIWEANVMAAIFILCPNFPHSVFSSFTPSLTSESAPFGWSWPKSSETCTVTGTSLVSNSLVLSIRFTSSDCVPVKSSNQTPQNKSNLQNSTQFQHQFLSKIDLFNRDQCSSHSTKQHFNADMVKGRLCITLSLALDYFKRGKAKLQKTLNPGENGGFYTWTQQHNQNWHPLHLQSKGL